MVEQALELPAKTGEHSYEPELYRIRGELLRLLGREEEARGNFLRALHIARQQGTRTYEQRARERLGRQRQALEGR